MENKAFACVYRYPLRWKDFEKFSPKSRAAVALVSFAASELNTIKRLCICTSHDSSGVEEADLLMQMQRLMTLRTWSAKIFEFVDFVNTCATRNEIDDEVLITIFKDYCEKFEFLRDSDGYQVARNIRNEIANHYSLKAATKNLDHVSNDVDCSFYFHEFDGNSFFPVGEEVIFAGRLNRRGANLNEEEKLKLFSDWMNWNEKASDWVGRLHEAVVKKFVYTSFPSKRLEKRVFWLPPNMVGDATEIKIPLFLRKD